MVSLRLDERVVAGIEELDLGTESGCRGRSLVTADRLDLLERLALQPLARRLAALAVGDAHHDSPLAAHRRCRDRTARAPHEVAGMGAHHEERRGCISQGGLLSAWCPPEADRGMRLCIERAGLVDPSEPHP